MLEHILFERNSDSALDRLNGNNTTESKLCNMCNLMHDQRDANFNGTQSVENKKVGIDSSFSC